MPLEILRESVTVVMYFYTCLQHAWAPQKLLPWRALKGISSTKIHWSTFYNIVTQIYNTYRALLEPPPAWYCAQIPTCRASGSVIYTKANEWLSNLG